MLIGFGSVIIATQGSVMMNICKHVIVKSAQRVVGILCGIILLTSCASGSVPGDSSPAPTSSSVPTSPADLTPPLNLPVDLSGKTVSNLTGSQLCRVLNSYRKTRTGPSPEELSAREQWGLYMQYYLNDMLIAAKMSNDIRNGDKWQKYHTFDDGIFNLQIRTSRNSWVDSIMNKAQPHGVYGGFVPRIMARYVGGDKKDLIYISYMAKNALSKTPIVLPLCLRRTTRGLEILRADVKLSVASKCLDEEGLPKYACNKVNIACQGRTEGDVLCFADAVDSKYWPETWTRTSLNKNLRLDVFPASSIGNFDAPT